MNKKSNSLWLLLNKILSGEDQHQIKWKNSPAKHCAYVPTEIEHIANICSHGLMILPSALASMLLYLKSETYDHQMVSIIYGSALVLLFSISFAYHWVFYQNKNVIMKDILHRLDRAMIYIFIAGSYYPWLTLENFKYPSIAAFLRWLIWVLALIGVLYQQIFHERYKCVETMFYILIGLTPAIILVTVYGHEFIAMLELEIGGIFYLFGVIFFKSDGKLSCAHAIWHLFVGIAAAIHYFAILNHLYVSAADQQLD